MLSTGEQEEIYQALETLGVAGHLIKGGLAGLLRDWERAVAECEQGYRGCLEAYRNDLYGREIVHRLEQQVSASLAAKIAMLVEPIDQRLRALLVGDECIGDADEQRSKPLSPEIHWWYFGYPRTGRPE